MQVQSYKVVKVISEQLFREIIYQVILLYLRVSPLWSCWCDCCVSNPCRTAGDCSSWEQIRRRSKAHHWLSETTGIFQSVRHRLVQMCCREIVLNPRLFDWNQEFASFFCLHKLIFRAWIFLQLVYLWNPCYHSYKNMCFRFGCCWCHLFRDVK